MAMKTKGLIKKSTDTTQKTSVGNSYDAAKKATLVLNMPSGFPLNFHLEGLWVQMSSLNSSPTKLTIKISKDANGDECIVTGTESTIETGVTTATDGSCVYKIDLDYVFSSSSVYVFFKTDTGTVSVDAVELTYNEG
tara:strand:+ start:1767 stop:2177 length:411 start_codon:yes stop_codon:yes gene_type:complete